jgi:bifunctional DNA-binding transcriptional regulator/antitoxin component of YhaV-PrlF toxin-antitoxin module
MTKKEVELLTKVGPKGQIVLKKEAQSMLKIKPGTIVKQIVTPTEVRIKPVTRLDVEREMKRMEKLAKRLGKHWPKGLTSVDLIKEERR